ncbi:MAG: hypothetical protein D6678_08005 [Zetaproteobacteria bacterium]|nr:MAG: hypothetical protein D6678_08005 [Zetaproteobacteria bacterium]
MTEHNEQTIDARESMLRELGQKLRAAREEQGRSIADCAQALRLRKPYLVALESGDWTQLPGDAYAIGFLKQYASLLALDISNELATIRSGDYRLTKPLTFPDPPIAPGRRWAYLAAAAFVVLLIVFNVAQLNRDASPKQKPGAMVADQASHAAPAKPAAPPVGEPKPSHAPPVSEPKPSHAPPVGEPKPSHAPPVGEPKPSPAPAVASEEQAPEATSQPPSVPAKPAKAAKAAAVPASVAHKVRFHAAGGDVWLEVYESVDDGKRGPRRIYRLLKQGETRILETNQGMLLITAGNPRALEVTIDETPVIRQGTLGKHKKIVRNYPLPLASKP